MARSRLGRGLEALIPVEPVGEEAKSTATVPLRLIDPNPYQPRRQFDQETLEELAQSIKLHGILQPIIVRQKGRRYQLLAGERRCRAAELAGLVEIPALVKELSDREMMELSIVENLQREDLNPLDEALGYDQLVKQLGLTQEEVAQRVGRSRPHVANMLRLLQLPQSLQELVSRETISAGHARALLAISDPALQHRLTEIVVKQGLNVRQTEELVKRHSGRDNANVSRETKKKRPAEIVDLEQRLATSLGTQVRLLPGRKRGKIEIVYYDNDDLERLLELLLQ
ncbi:MAG TPA: ParB/RepB/Spo0J family partition protein [Firmicutes bacterium]|nr:ParB/RepB/Spo0J family partition protein [Bacillota bacterium]